MSYPRVVIAGVASGVGKTTVTLGLIAAFKRRGLDIRPFKAGPDYIDPSYHTLSSGHTCRNLDTWMLPREAVLELFERQAKRADISIIEGVMGLYDGLADGEEGSTAHLARILKSPVILVVDCRSMSRSAGAVVLGYKKFDRDTDIKGVILNNIARASHYENIKRSIESATGIAVLGHLPKNQDIGMRERHLGLVPAVEKAPQGHFINKLARLAGKNIDIGKILKISRNAPELPGFRKILFADKPAAGIIKISVARDKSFNFYYEDNLDILRHLGSEIVEFKPLSDKSLPEDCHGIYIGGGFPELYAEDLSRNIPLKRDILKRVESGMPVYAECGGLMYLAKEIIDFTGRRFPMTGVFALSIKMGKKLRALGYVNMEARKRNILCDRGKKIRAHMFHWSYFDNKIKRADFAYTAKKERLGRFVDGLTKKNALASYGHLHFGSDPVLAKNFVNRCLEYKKGMAR